ncbi:MAG: hypothetical protein SGI88_04255 [Candidatus Hydrogenedentes bacterium]|nr:hypothetical protein [Candidatus Hydrogenedentota bacterium]
MSEAVAEPSFIERASTAFGAFMERVSTAVSDGITAVFKPILSPIFDPINNFLNSVYMPWATLFSLGLFGAGMLWVFLLKKEYVNLDSPGKGILYDLRLWTVISMTPHVIVYLYFAKWSD